MASQWRCKLSGKEIGPVTFQDLAEMVRAGKLTEDDLVTRAEIVHWVPAREVVGLFRAAEHQAGEAPAEDKAPPAGRAASGGHGQAKPPSERGERMPAVEDGTSTAPSQPPTPAAGQVPGEPIQPSLKIPRTFLKIPRLGKAGWIAISGLFLLVAVAVFSGWWPGTSPRFPVPQHARRFRPEAATGQAGARPAKMSFAASDANADGKLTRQELAAAVPTPHQPEQAARILKLADQDGDGTLSEAEFENALGLIRLVTADEDGDGELTLAEWKAKKTPQRIKQAERRFRGLDKNGDGTVTFEEIASLPRVAQPRTARFAAMDANGDGILTLEEYRQDGAEAIQEAPRVFGILDKNADGTLTSEEFADVSAETRFRILDTNGDGALTLDEFKDNKEDPAALKRAEERFKDKDRNGDGTLTMDEFAARDNGPSDRLSAEYPTRAPPGRQLSEASRASPQA